MRAQRYSRVPWWLPDSDLRPAISGEFKRDCRSDEGQPQRHFGLPVEKEYSPGFVGFIAIRCERQGGRVVPLAMALPDSAIVLSEVEAIEPAQSNPRRVDIDDNGANDVDEP